MVSFTEKVLNCDSDYLVMRELTGPKVIKNFMLYSAEHDIFSAFIFISIENFTQLN